MKELIRRAIGTYEFSELTIEDEDYKLYTPEQIITLIKNWEMRVENLIKGAYKPDNQLPLTLIEKEGKHGKK